MRIPAIDTIKQENKKITVAGWVQARRNHGKIIFIDLRDASGILQIVFTPHQSKHGAGQAPNGKSIYDLAQELRPEWILKILGTVKKRPDNMKNPELATGDFEMLAEDL